MAGRRSSGGPDKGRKIGLIAIGVLLVPLFMPTVLFLALAMLPTFVAIIVDRGPKKFGGMTVAGLNFAGAAPSLMSLWFDRHTLDNAIFQLTDVFSLLLIFGSAGFGWVLYAATPTLVMTFLSATASRRLGALKTEQKNLIEDWGPEVATVADIGFVEEPEVAGEMAE